MNPDDPLTDLEARLRAWRPGPLPPSLHARLLAAGPAPRRRLPRGVRAAAGLALGIAVLQTWVYWGGELPSASAARKATLPANTRLIDAAWTPGASLTMNLATGVPASNLPAPWSLDNDPESVGGLLNVWSVDGKLPLKVDCQF